MDRNELTELWNVNHNPEESTIEQGVQAIATSIFVLAIAIVEAGNSIAGAIEDQKRKRWNSTNANK